MSDEQNHQQINPIHALDMAQSVMVLHPIYSGHCICTAVKHMYLTHSK